MREKRIDSKANLGTVLIDMYAKCGCIESARKVFDDVVVKDVFCLDCNDFWPCMPWVVQGSYWFVC